jgi:MYXO-CTERM domain-containing protein
LNGLVWCLTLFFALPLLGTLGTDAALRSIPQALGHAHVGSSHEGTEHARTTPAGEDVEVVPAPGRAAIGMRTVHIGRQRAPRRVPPLVDRRTLAHETVLVREGVEERYQTGPLGVEQTYRIEARPPGAGPLAIEVAFDGLEASMSDPDTVVLRDGAGATQAVYRGLRVDDAAGRQLAAHMEASGSTATLVADDEGASYPVVVDPLVAVQQAELTASGGMPGDRFGWQVSVSGDIAIVSAPPKASPGAVYVFVRTGTSWAQQAAIVPTAGWQNTEAWSVSVSGDTAVVGAVPVFATDVNLDWTGAAHVFVREGSTWTEQAELAASDDPGNYGFGAQVSVSGDTLVVGALNTLAAYVFVRSGTSWTQQAKLTLGDAASSVSVSGDTAVVGSFDAENSGRAYVFVRSGTSWTQQAELVPGDSMMPVSFGNSVAVSGDTVVIGAPNTPVGNAYIPGVTYVFVRSGTSWTPQAELTSNDADTNLFGTSVAVSGDTAIIGSNSDSGVGAAFLFTRNGTSWTQQAKLVPSDAANLNDFGSSVSISGNTIVAGAPFHLGTGAAYIYVLGDAPGDPCTAPTDCASGFCVDGVCCATACTGAPCEACSLAAGATADGTCTPLTGPSCNDGNACTTSDTCVAGTCKGTPLDCAAHNECEENGTCDPTTDQCTHPIKPDKTPCSTGGTCEEGVCSLSFGGCGCRVAGPSSDAAAWGAALLVLLPAIWRRRGRRAV